VSGACGRIAAWVGTTHRVLWFVLALSASAARADPPPARAEFLVGQSLFAGGMALRGRIYTHLVDLPPAAVRCANCHALADGPEVPRSLAPRLTHDLLLHPQPRRGGPMSTYDRYAFCKLLRRGIDPASVVISVEMPRYTIDDSDCLALWRYLSSNGHENKSP
jgi:hypothetical protein